VNQRETQADGDGRETLRGESVGCADDDKQEHRRHDDFCHKRRHKRVSARRMFSIAVKCEAGANIKTRLTARNQKEDSTRRDPTRGKRRADTGRV